MDSKSKTASLRNLNSIKMNPMGIFILLTIQTPTFLQI